jgi:hypothetical protein
MRSACRSARNRDWAMDATVPLSAGADRRGGVKMAHASEDLLPDGYAASGMVISTH